MNAGADTASGSRAGGPRTSEEDPGQEAREVEADGEAGGRESEEQTEERAQSAWEARKDLYRHSPAFMLGHDAHVGGSLVGGSQYGVSGGHVGRDVVLGPKTEIYHLGSGLGGRAVSGQIPAEELEPLERLFAVDEEEFGRLTERLRSERLLILTGPRSSGRRMAALMMLRRLDAVPVHALDRDLELAELPQHLQEGQGHLLCDLPAHDAGPLRESHALAVRDKLTATGGYLVITADPGLRAEGIAPAPWDPPSATAVLARHLRTLVDEETARELLGLEAVGAFLNHSPQPREAAGLAPVLARHARGEVSAAALERFSVGTVEQQVREWFDDTALSLRDKAFLVSLAVFNEGPYALTAELGDLLFVQLQKTQDPHVRPRVPVFGTSIDTRLQLARARGYAEEEATEWGPVTQFKAAYKDGRAALVLMREVWTGHPSARPGLLDWLRKLADDGRPLVRTRAAATAAVLTARDLPSAIGLLVQGWAGAAQAHRRVTAVNTVALAHAMGAPHMPQVVRSWCDSEQKHLRWTAIRAYALLGEERPEEALTALRAAVVRPEDADEGELAEAASSAALLLVADTGTTVYAHLLRALDEERTAQELALRAFLTACRWSDGDDSGSDGDLPILLGRFGRAFVQETPWGQSSPNQEAHQETRAIATLWRAVLSDRDHTRTALETFADWVRRADRNADTEWALSALLPALAVTEKELARLSHLLRTMRAEGGGPPPPVARRLLTTIAPG